MSSEVGALDVEVMNRGFAWLDDDTILFYGKKPGPGLRFHTLYGYEKLAESTRKTFGDRRQVVAVRDTRALVLSGPETESFLISNPRITYRMLQAMARRLRASNRWTG